MFIYMHRAHYYFIFFCYGRETRGKNKQEEYNKNQNYESLFRTFWFVLIIETLRASTPIS